MSTGKKKDAGNESSLHVYEKLSTRQNELKSRLQEIALPPQPGPAPRATKIPAKDGEKKRQSILVSHQVPLLEKTDTHWDFVLKEMQWLSTDFTSERKRHHHSRRKLANGVRQYFKTKETRALSALAQAEFKRRRLAAKIGRNVSKWWNKMDQIVTYQQKLTYDQERHQAMNRKLVKLVQQTERYTQSLVDGTAGTKKRGRGGTKRKQTGEEGDDDVHDEGATDDDSDDDHNDERAYQLKIEQVLAVGQRRRKIHDYARLAKLNEQQNRETPQSEETTLYGESTTEDSGSDASFDPRSDSSQDDETTLEQAEVEEQLERTSQKRDNSQQSYAPDPVELKKLQEEATMDIEKVMDRLRQEPPTLSEYDALRMMEEEETSSEEEDDAQRRVHFSPQVEVQQAPRTKKDASDTNNDPICSTSNATALGDPGEDADDDRDASDLEDFVKKNILSLGASAPSTTTQDDGEGDDDDEFVANEQPVDDETTMEAEESLPQEMTAQEEIALLEQENDLSIEELRACYAGLLVLPEVRDCDEDNDAIGDSKPALTNENQSGQSGAVGTDALRSDTSKGTPGDAAEANFEAEEDEEFQPQEDMEPDDETTMEAEERLGRDMSYEEELAMLQRENEMSVEELRAMYAGKDETLEASENGTGDEPDEAKTEPSDPIRRTSRRNRGKTELANPVASNDADDDDDGEFEPAPDVEPDDETTIEAEEKMAREMSYEEELSLLKNENEMSVEELRAMYAGAYAEVEENQEPEKEKGGDDDTRSNETPPRSNKRNREDSSQTDSAKKSRKEELQDVGADALSVLEMSAELAKNTLATRPYLLANWVKLREYQQIGLNWLVSMQTRRLNGILADEMGLGKTLQTIAMISYLASYKGIWGPHLIIVPTSVMVNWETEFKRFCPGLKVLCYYGSAKRRKELRTGWTKANWNHVVITSYQLVVQDAFAFKRKRWYYMVLDEAQNIKNFQSQRWQTLINFNTQRRLLLTGTPLQNSLMELWSLLHFLMPYIFRSRKEFSFWFENPMNDMIEGTASENASVINRLHGIIRPFVLRRLKKDVETQMPGKYEHIVKCTLSRRQMLMYEEFMARSSTRKALKKSGNFMGMMNVLMQLRKVCNHPDLFEPRSVITPFVLDPVEKPMPSMVFSLKDSCSFFGTASEFLRKPLWCGSMAEPSVPNACRHDEIESEELKGLEKPIPLPEFKPTVFASEQGVSKELIKLEEELEKKRFTDRSGTINFLNSLNSWRCRAPSFPFPGRLLDRLDFLIRSKDDRGFSALETPSHFLALLKSQQERAEECDEMIKKYVFCVPKAGVKPSAHSTQGTASRSFDKMLLEPIEEYMRPFARARARLSSFFPDKKLIQFDAGKLQTLAELLRELKRGGHRTLIFTQMSKMLDILEAFLNLNGHTYMRLDGSTGVDRRQRLMDRFNNDPKIFCFILSTRSGGTGVNLIGADTVVFYDSDWNPAMDAQAQDRVHRIGQTRDCHVYRLVTEHSIEENILLKAKQKKNLDILVMDRGKFDSSHLFSHDQSARLSSENSDSQDMKAVYTKGGLRAILGVSLVEDEEAPKDAEYADDDKKDMTSEQMENAMTALEDADDVEALRGARKEAAEELQEFDETAEVKSGDPDVGPEESIKETEKAERESEPPVNEETEENDLEKEFESWQTQVGMDKDAIEASLSPVERYGFHFRTDSDPFVSMYAVLEYKRKAEEAEEEDDEIDIDAIEREKSFEERQALADGDLLGTCPEPNDLIRHRSLFQRESARSKATKKKRTLTGENWEIRVDARQKQNYWYNVDTGEAIWDKPRVLMQLEEYEIAYENKWSALPLRPLVHIMSFLQPYPDRMMAARVCKQFHRAASDPSFVFHVYAVEMGAYTRDEKKIEINHFRTLQDAVIAAKPGDTIELGDGHYWVNEDIIVSNPISIVGDENNPSNVVVEMSGSAVDWRAKGGWIEGVTFRRPKLNASGEPLMKSLFTISDGSVDVYHCSFDNDGSDGQSIVVFGPSAKGTWNNVSVKGGVLEENPGSISFSTSSSLIV